jgi:peptide deformylase
MDERQRKKIKAKIWKISDKEEEKFLRRKTADFDFSKFTKKEISELVKKMKETMIKADGVGLSANQIGLDMNFFVAQVPTVEERGENFVITGQKFYAIFNPKITKASEEKFPMEEGCLSVPGGVSGEVERPEKITLEGQDKNGKKIKIKAWGLLARVFQHEVDHLNGTLFIDKCEKTKKSRKEIKI